MKTKQICRFIFSSFLGHWRSTCIIKIVTCMGDHQMWLQKSDFSYYKDLLLKERISSLWEQILSFKRSSHFENGRNSRDPLFDLVVSL